jgi:hypothetical protein
MVSTHTTVLLNTYDPATDLTRPALSFPCKDIISIDDVTVWCTDGYYARVSAKSRNAITGGLQIVVRCYSPTNVTGLDAAGHAAHAHDMISKLGKGSNAASAFTDQFGDAAGGFTIAGGSAANGGVQNAAAMAHAAAVATAGGAEINKNNAQFTIYGTAVGYV